MCGFIFYLLISPPFPTLLPLLSCKRLATLQGAVQAWPPHATSPISHSFPHTHSHCILHKTLSLALITLSCPINLCTSPLSLNQSWAGRALHTLCPISSTAIHLCPQAFPGPGGSKEGPSNQTWLHTAPHPSVPTISP